METKLIPLNQPVPELPVADVERAQQHYRDKLGFEIGWLEQDQSIGAVQRDKAVLFFRKKDKPFDPVTQWVFCEDIEASYAEIQQLGAHISDPLETKPWGIRQFTVQDPDGNQFHFHAG